MPSPSRTPDALADFVRARTAPAAVPLAPELRLYQATELTPLWHATAAELAGWDDSPYWAFPWAGGQALARTILDEPALVAGRRVFDFATGSGLVALAAARAGAAEVIACDLDPFCAAAVALNAGLNGLTITDDRMKVRPVLATEVPTVENGGVSKDGKTITYKLRKGVKWSDGKPFTSADVAFTQEFMVNPKANVSNPAGYDHVSKVDTPDENTVVFHLKTPFAPFVATTFQWGILPKHVLGKAKDLNKAEWNRTLNPSLGAFAMKEWKQSQYIVAERNKAYWGKRPNLDKIMVKFVSDPNGLFAQLKSGEIDWFEYAPSMLTKNIEKLPKAKLYKTDTLSFENYAFIMKPGSPLADKNVRIAISHAVNVAQIVKTLYPGERQAATTQHPMSFAFNEKLTPYPYDTAKAKQMLADAGWKDANGDGVLEKGKQKLSLVISTTTGQSDREQKEEIIQQDLKKVGIAAEIKNYEAQTFFAPYGQGGILQGGKCDVAIFTGVTAADPDNWSQWHSSQIPSAGNPMGQNCYRVKNSKIDELTVAGQSEMDPAKRAEIYKEIDKIVLDNAYTLLERWWKNYDGVTTRVHNAKPNPTLQGNLWNASELWVSGK